MTATNHKRKLNTDLPIMSDEEGNVVLFHPFIPDKAKDYVCDTLSTRWIGQGPKVERFEQKFKEVIKSDQSPISVGAGTDALHLAYVLAGIRPGDEVVSPVFTCTATNIPLAHMGAIIRFADVQTGTLNIDPNHVRALMTEKTKAIVCVHYGGLPCDMQELREIADEWKVPIIEDAAHAFGASYMGTPIGNLSEFTMFSFQAIKHITTGDGGMLMLKDSSLVSKAKRIRWFGIDREAKQGGIWENDITELGFKYQMTDISAAIGLAAIEEYPQMIEHRKKLYSIYEKELISIPGIQFVGSRRTDREHGAWLCTILAEDRRGLQAKLAEHHIESNQVHFRNDRYSIFKSYIEEGAYPHMDTVEDQYLVLPLHTKVSEEDVLRICDLVRKG